MDANEITVHVVNNTALGEHVDTNIRRFYLIELNPKPRKGPGVFIFISTKVMLLMFVD